MIVFYLDILAVPKGRPRFGKGFTYTPTKTRRFETTLAALVKRNKSCPMTPLVGPLKVSMTFFVKAPKRKLRNHPSVKPDLDNYAKGVSDSLNGILWKDDAQIVDMVLSKRYAQAPQIQITVERVFDDSADTN